MPESLEKQARRSPLGSLRSLAPLVVFLCFGSADALAEGIEAYGARMCADAGIALEDCSFVADPIVARDAKLARDGDKTATLLEHGRQVCEDANVPLEDCRALPTGFRGERAPAPAFLTVPQALPPVDTALLPAPVVAPAPIPARRPVIRDPRPPIPSPVRQVRARPALVGDPGIRSFRPPAQPPRLPAYGFAPAATPVIVPPIEPDVRRFPQPVPLAPPVEPFALRDGGPLPLAGPAYRPTYRYVEEPASIVERRDVFIAERPERVRREGLFRREGRFGRADRFFLEEWSGRCLRAVRYSPPPSYRYVTC